MNTDYIVRYKVNGEGDSNGNPFSQIVAAKSDEEAVEKFFENLTSRDNVDVVEVYQKNIAEQLIPKAADQRAANKFVNNYDTGYEPGRSYLDQEE
jgi:ribosomal protein L20A (L18A)